MEDSLFKELNEMEASKLSDIEYNSIKKETETINKNQEEMKNTLSEKKKTLEGITIRLGEAEDRTIELEDKVERNTHVELQHEKRPKYMKIA